MAAAGEQITSGLRRTVAYWHLAPGSVVVVVRHGICVWNAWLWLPTRMKCGPDLVVCISKLLLELH